MLHHSGLFSLLFLVLTTCADPVNVPVRLQSSDPLEVWSSTANKAAKSVSEQIKLALNSSEVLIKNVNLKSSAVLQGKQIQLNLGIDGAAQRFFISDEASWQPLSTVLPKSEGALVSEGDWTFLERVLGGILPEFVLAGPLELVLKEAAQVSLAVPHAVDAGLVKRIILGDGVAVRVKGALSVGLQKPLDIGPSPRSVFEAVPGDGVHAHQSLAGVLHLAGVMQRQAVHHWEAGEGARGAGSPNQTWLSLDLALSAEHGAGLQVVPLISGAEAPRLKVNRIGPLAVELKIRKGQVAPSTAVGLRQPWPFVATPLQSLVPLEKLLSGVLGRRSARRAPAAASAVAPAEAQPVGPQLSLLGGSLEAVSLLKIQFEVENRQPASVPAAGEYEPFRIQSSPYEVWEAVVQMKPDGSGGVSYMTLTADLIDKAESTVTISQTVELMLSNNVTVPLDYGSMYMSAPM